MIFKITLKEIEAIFANAKHQHEYVIELYKLAVARAGIDWTKIEKMPFCHVNKARHELLFDMAIKFDKEHHPGVMAGGMWMNNGFSVDERMEFDDGVRVPLAEIKYKEVTL